MRVFLKAETLPYPFTLSLSKGETKGGFDSSTSSLLSPNGPLYVEV